MCSISAGTRANYQSPGPTHSLSIYKPPCCPTGHQVGVRQHDLSNCACICVCLQKCVPCSMHGAVQLSAYLVGLGLRKLLDALLRSIASPLIQHCKQPTKKATGVQLPNFDNGLGWVGADASSWAHKGHASTRSSDRPLPVHDCGRAKL